jgi:hypothetical protein
MPHLTFCTRNPLIDLVVPSNTTSDMRLPRVAAQCETVTNICSRMEATLLKWKVLRTLTKELQIGRMPAVPLRNEKDALSDHMTPHF